MFHLELLSIITLKTTIDDIAANYYGINETIKVA